MNRVIKVARMQLINKWTFLGIPMAILLGSTLLTFAIWAMLPPGAREGTLYSGSGQAVMWYFLALGIQSLTYTFPFSQAMSVSRRTFYLGTLGLFAAIAMAYSILYYLLGLVEKATGGWGFNGQLFALDWIAGNHPVIQVLFYFVAMVLLFMIGFWGATVYLRWKATGLLVAGIGVAALLLGVLAAVGLNDAWPQVGAWFAAMQVLGLSIVLGLVCVALAGGSYLTLRRATT